MILKPVMIHIIVFLGLFFCSLSNFGQDIKFNNITAVNGLSGHVVNTITQDKYGFIWIGTNNGLNLYDGNSFTPYYAETDNISSLSGNDVSSICISGDTLWIGTREGLCMMDVVRRVIKRISIGPNTNVRIVYSGREAGILWVGTNTGLVRLSLKDFSFTGYNTKNTNIQNDIVRAIYEDSDLNLWVGTFDQLHKLPHNSSFFEVFNLMEDSKTSIKNNLILDIKPFSTFDDHKLLIGSQTGLAMFSRRTNKFDLIDEKNSGLTSPTIKTILVNDQSYWLGTDYGLAEMDSAGRIVGVSHREPFNNKSIVNSTIWTSFCDLTGNLWFGTNNGISIISNNAKRFNHTSVFLETGNTKIGCELKRMYESSDNKLWFATQSGILKLNFDKKEKSIASFIRPEWNDKIFTETKTIYSGSSGQLWIGTNGGIFVWDQKNRGLVSFTANSQSSKGLRSNYILQFIEDPGKHFFVNTYAGLHLLTGDLRSLKDIRFEFITDLTESALIYDAGFIWFTSGNALYCLNPDNLKVEKINLRSSFKKENFSTLCNSADHKIWIGSADGLLKYDPISGKDSLFFDKGLAGNQIINLIEDNYGNIWGSTNTILFKFITSSNKFEFYPVVNELQLTHFESNSCIKRSDGSLCFIEMGGYVNFLPENVVISSYVPSVRITSLAVLNQTIEYGKKYNGKLLLETPLSFSNSLVLEYGHRSFSLGFSSLQFGNREGIRYAYKLEGIDPDWKYLSDSRGIANYTTVPSGTYLFRLKGTNVDGVWNSQETILKIRIRPPLWASPIFIIFYVLLLIGLTVSIFKYYSNLLKWKNQLQIIRLEKDHSEEMTRAKMQFFTNVFHEFRTPLSLIIGPLEKLAQNANLDSAGKSMVELIGKNAQRLVRLNNQLLDFRQLENKQKQMEAAEFEFIEFARSIFTLFTDKATRKKITYTFEPEIEAIRVNMDAEKIETILFNLLSNAFKFTNKKGIITLIIGVRTIQINRKSADCLYFSIKDTGIGISDKDQERIFERYYQSDESMKMERGSGIGLTLVEEYVRMHHGEISVRSKPGEGSEFLICLPLNQSYVQEEANLSESSAVTVSPQRLTGHKDEPVLLAGKPLVLLVEDDKELSEFIALSLKGKYNVLTAIDGLDGNVKAEKYLPDLIVSDILMPGIDGQALTKKLKNSPRTAHIPVIILSSKSEKDSQLAGLKCGADAYMIKPFDIEHLEAIIDNFIRRGKQLSRHLKTEQAITPRIKESLSGDEKMLQKIISIIEKNISDTDLGIDKLSKETGFSPSIINRKIKNVTGLTTNELIRKVRLQQAEQLLKTRKFSVAEVMDQVGFSNHSYFSKCFRKVYHMSPKEYIGS